MKSAIDVLEEMADMLKRKASDAEAQAAEPNTASEDDSYASGMAWAYRDVESIARETARLMRSEEAA